MKPTVLKSRPGLYQKFIVIRERLHQWKLRVRFFNKLLHRIGDRFSFFVFISKRTVKFVGLYRLDSCNASRRILGVAGSRKRISSAIPDSPHTAEHLR